MPGVFRLPQIDFPGDSRFRAEFPRGRAPPIRRAPSGNARLARQLHADDAAIIAEADEAGRIAAAAEADEEGARILGVGRHGFIDNHRNEQIAQIMGERNVDADEAARILGVGRIDNHRNVDADEAARILGVGRIGAEDDGRPRGQPLRDFIGMNAILMNAPGRFIPPGEREAIQGYRFAMCPVCLLVAQEDGGLGACLYHSHRCPVGRRNERLWRKYTYERKLEHCFTCGRACRDHEHYRLTNSDNTPGVHPRPVVRMGYNAVGHDFFDCSGSGGGVRRELIARLLGIIDYMNSLRAGDIEDNQAFVTACSDAAERAAMDPRMLEDADASLRNRRFIRNVREDLRFGRHVPLNRAEANAVLQAGPGQALMPVFAYLAPQGGWRPVIDGAGAGLMRGLGVVAGAIYDGVGMLCARRRRGGVVEPNMAVGGVPPCPDGRQVPEELTIANRGDRRCYMCVLDGGEDNPRSVYRFRHRDRADANYVHTDEFLICLVHLSSYITAHTMNSFNADFHNPDCFCNVRDGCGGVIEPCELGVLRQSNAALYNQYVAAHFPPEGGRRRSIRKGRKKHRNTKKTLRKRHR